MKEIGGIVLIIGVLTRVASILFIILMIGAIITLQKDLSVDIYNIPNAYSDANLW